MTTTKVALVTGAAAGIGAACSKRLAQDGVAVGVLDLDEARCADTVAAIDAEGGRAVALGADVSDRGQVQAAVGKLRAAFGPVTIVVNNAGVTDFTPFEEVTEELFDFIYKVNVLGPIIVTQETLPDMKAAQWGRVVNISSSSAQTGAKKMAVYSSSKGAIISLTRTLAQELGPHGITVNTIPPGRSWARYWPTRMSAKRALSGSPLQCRFAASAAPRTSPMRARSCAPRHRAT